MSYDANCNIPSYHVNTLPQRTHKVNGRMICPRYAYACGDLRATRVLIAHVNERFTLQLYKIENGA